MGRPCSGVRPLGVRARLQAARTLTRLQLRAVPARYARWFYFTVLCAVAAAWMLPFQFAFVQPGCLIR